LHGEVDTGTRQPAPQWRRAAAKGAERSQRAAPGARLHGSWSTNTRPPQHQKPAHEHMFVWASITSQSPLDTGLYVRYWPLRPREGPSLKLSSKVRFCGARPRSRGTGAPPSCGLRHLKHSSMGGDRPQSCAARDHEHGSPNSHPRPFKDASQTSNVQMMRSKHDPFNTITSKHNTNHDHRERRRSRPPPSPFKNKKVSTRPGLFCAR